MRLDEAYIKSLGGFPFLAGLELQNPEAQPAIFSLEFHRLLAIRPQTLEDHTMHRGREGWQLFVVGDDEELRDVPIRLGRKVIYRPRNVAPQEERDDIDEAGETVREALSRVESTYDYAVLHRWGHARSGAERPKGVPSDDYEVITVAHRQQPQVEFPSTTRQEAELECGRHPVDCSTCPLSENCPLHGSSY